MSKRSGFYDLGPSSLFGFQAHLSGLRSFRYRCNGLSFQSPSFLPKSALSDRAP